MKELEVTYYPEKDYRELFTVAVDPISCMDTCIGITNEGTFLYINEKLANSSSAYWMDREFFSIDREEFCHYLSIAKENGEIENAINNGQTTEEELELLAGEGTLAPQ